MPCSKIICLCAIALCTTPLGALEPNEILVIANVDFPPSLRLARYYCQKRGLPSGYVVPVRLGATLGGTISRADYERRLARPLRQIFSTRDDMRNIKCLVTTYGVPYRVGGRGPLPGSEQRLEQLRQRLQQEKDAIAALEAEEQPDAVERAEHARNVAELEMDINRITGVETNASVDSELSLVMWGAYELYRWRPNALRGTAPQPFKTLMVSRLDGPTYEIAQGLVDKAIAAETNGLAGTAYIDSRGLFDKDGYGYYDQSLRALAFVTQLRTSLPVKEQRTQELFQPGDCPQTALYCGWYSVASYVDAFEFVPGAVGYHIASLEAVSLRDPNSGQWCPNLLAKGITATLGPVGEPYLAAFPEPKNFFAELFDGRCLIEAYYRTKPFNSWQMILVGDPLYTPFPKD